MPAVIDARYGTLETLDDGRQRLRFERHLAHPMERVWSALTDPAELTKWFPADVEIDLRVGGPMRFPFREGEGPTLEGEVLELDPPRLFEFSWADEVLRFELTAAGAGTRLLFTVTMEPDAIKAGRDAAGWHVCLDALEAHLAGIEPGAAEWKDLQRGYMERFELTYGSLEQLPDGGHRLRFERLLAHPVERVWAAITAPEELRGWLGAAEVDLRVGGRFRLAWLNSDSVMQAEITALDPPRLLELDSDIHGRLRFELAENYAGCRLTFLATYPPRSPDDLRELLAGWDVHLDFLDESLDGRPIDWPIWPRDRWEQKYERYATRAQTQSVPRLAAPGRGR